ncbi:MAG TPA: hypothetical protein PLB12_12350 [Candidatus Goldiibacteriota bacterium]|nr:hypothetical protein [Candidatus Goldiibacteriota bacterium]
MKKFELLPVILFCMLCMGFTEKTLQVATPTPIPVKTINSKLSVNNYADKFDAEGKNIYMLSEGGYLVIGKGVTNNNQDTDILLIKIDKNGKKVWSKYYGGEGYDAGFDLCSSIQGKDILITGESEGKIVVMKIDLEGKLIWNNTYTYKEESKSYGRYIFDSKDVYNVFTVSENDKDDLYCIAIDDEGKKIKSTIFGGKNSINIQSMTNKNTGNPILLGSIGYNAYIGEILNNFTFKFTLFIDPYFNIGQFPDNELLKVGASPSYIADASFDEKGLIAIAAFDSSDEDSFVLFRYDWENEKKAFTWLNRYSFSSIFNDERKTCNIYSLNKMLKLNDNNFIAVGKIGRKNAITGEANGFIIKFNPEGKILFAKVYQEVDEFNGIVDSEDGNFVVFSNINSSYNSDSISIMKFDTNGNRLW